MKPLDYRKALGLGFDSMEKLSLLKTITLNNLKKFEYYQYREDELLDFCNAVGKPFLYSNETYEDAVEILEDINGLEYIFAYVMFINTQDDCEIKYILKSRFISALESIKTNYSTIEDEDGFFVFPEGAKELDEALVSEPLEWLKDYPKSHGTFSRALKQYSDGEHVRDVADNFRKALEEFFQEFLGNTRNLANNKAEICQFLGINNAEPEVASMMQALLNSYDKLNNSAAKHNDRLDSKYLEFLMYQTGLIIRMIITVKESQIL